MNANVLTFPKGGIHPPGYKSLTAEMAIEPMPTPTSLELILGQHIGVPCSPVVAKKDKVAEGALVGEVTKGMGVPLHAPVAGTVSNLTESAHPIQVSSPSVILRVNKKEEPKSYQSSDWSGLSPDELREKIHLAGIVGIGGAGFPAHVKLTPPPGSKIDTLVLNGAECEPYLTADHRQMIEHPDQVIEGARIILSILGITECLVGIENNKPDAIAAMSSEAEKQTSAEARIEIKTLEVKYPQGAEKQLIQSVTGRRVASQGLPADHGVIVQNVSTARAIFEAVALDKPYYEKVVTISGKGIARPANLLVKVGTLVKDIVTHLGGTTEELAKVVLGGPMMGFAVSTLDIPITKTTSSILFLTRDEIDTDLFSNCIRCGRCVEACPMGLQPNEIGVYVEASQGENTTKFGTMECFECGCCAYVCPSKRPLVQFIRMAKSQLKRRAAG